MGRVTTNVGLVSGLPVQQIIDQLVSLRTRPRDLLTEKNKSLQTQQVGLTSLTALLVGMQASSRSLSQGALYEKVSVASSNADVLSAEASGNPPPGTHEITALRKAQAQQLQSARLGSRTAPLGAGSLSVRFGGFVDTTAPLALLGGGAGLARGKIRITDRSGASAEIDLSLSQSLGEVLTAINDNTVIQVRAEFVGDKIRLVDESGATASNLKVQEVGGGTTAASLGLAGVDVAATTALGADVLSLFGDARLEQLNDGLGVRFNRFLADAKVTLRDGTEVTLDFQKPGVAGTKPRGTTTPASGPSAQLTFTAVKAGAAYDGVQVRFVDDSTITAGREKAGYDALTKVLSIRIDAGKTTADQIVNALQADETISKLFVATRTTGVGTGKVSVGDLAILAGPQASGSTDNVASDNANLKFTAVAGGPAYDGVTVSFISDSSIVPGQETVSYDDSNPLDKRLTIRIKQGETTANQVVASFQRNTTVRALFTASLATGSNGTAVVSASDTATLTGGAIIEPIPAVEQTTVEDVLELINAASPAKLQASIAAGGDRLQLTDLTSGGGTFTIAALNESKAVADLGLLNAASGGTITGTRLLAGLGGSLLRSLGGIAGLTGLGLLDLRDRTGALATVNLSNAETLSEVVETINAAPTAIRARINSARNGLELVDNSGATTTTLRVQSGDTLKTAERLGILTDAAVTQVNSGTLNRQTVNENTLLASLNGGRGVSKSGFEITDTNGGVGRVSLDDSVKTVGDLLVRIKALGLAIQARINDAGDGIALVDTAGGSSTLRVVEGAGATAKDLNLLGPLVDLLVDNVTRKAVNGATTRKVTLDADDTLDDLATKLNDLKAGFSANVLNDGTSVKPYLLNLGSQVTGSPGELLIDDQGLNLGLKQTVAAQDALLRYGASGGAGSILVASSSNTFKDLLPGLTIDLKKVETTPAPVTITVKEDRAALGDTVSSVVEQLNRFFAKVAELTSYDAETDTAAALQGDTTVLRVQADVVGVISRRASGGTINSVFQLGINFSKDGKLEFDRGKLEAAVAADPQAVRDFLTRSGGLADELDTLAERLAGVGTGTLVGRAATVANRIQRNTDRVKFLNERLDGYRELLLRQFNQAELAISKVRSIQGALDQVAQLAAVRSG